MRFCPLIGEVGCREDCLFRFLWPDDPAASRAEPQIDCAIVSTSAIVKELGWRERTTKAHELTMAVEMARTVGLDRFVALITETLSNRPGPAGPSPQFSSPESRRNRKK